MTTPTKAPPKATPMTAGEKASIIRMLRYYGRLCSERRLALATREVAEHRQQHLALWMQRARDALVGQYHLEDDWTRLVRSLAEPVEKPQPPAPVPVSFAQAKTKAHAGDRLQARLAEFERQQAADAKVKEQQRLAVRRTMRADHSEQRAVLAALLEEIRPKATPAAVVQCRRVLPWVSVRQFKRVLRCSRCS